LAVRVAFVADTEAAKPLIAATAFTVSAAVEVAALEFVTNRAPPTSCIDATDTEALLFSITR
jgi:hypothetical protein